ncbi:hypothetical protein CRG98_026854 [Punica granatum]|uniref:RNase H type-1 domain-containing protein n=1 Tax=Punica granatum TaxID=22663 RepID=A0A2I0J974_PUNGR|nr:hypothetical protein CRG98_026854 [Punica granatum]
MWLSIVPQVFRHSFFSLPLLDWFVFDLFKEGCNAVSGCWSSVFGMGCWVLWKWRNKGVFKPNFSRPNNEGVVILRTSSAFLMSWSNRELLSCEAKAWSHPQAGSNLILMELPRVIRGWLGLEGFVRDEYGCWLSGFTQNIGWSTAIVAELWGAFTGLQHVWSLGYRKVILELDSTVARGLITGNSPGSLQVASLVRAIKGVSQERLGG